MSNKVNKLNTGNYLSSLIDINNNEIYIQTFMLVSTNFCVNVKGSAAMCYVKYQRSV